MENNKNKFLIIVDMQNDFINGSLGSEEAQKIIPNVIKKIKNFNGRIILTKDTHDKNYLETFEGKLLPVEHCIFNTYGWDISKDIIEACKEKRCATICKTTFGYIDKDIWGLHLGNMYHSDDEIYLKDLEIEIIGLCTDICVVSNALILRALYPNTKITVDASCCAGTTPEKHKAALEVMKSCQINVIGE